MLEIERTFLVKYLPENLKNYKNYEIFDIYIPNSTSYPKLRIRKEGDNYEITKKHAKNDNDYSELIEETIKIDYDEFEILKKLEGVKKIRKIRYKYPYENLIAEIDIFLDELLGLVTVDFEFNSKIEKDNFKIPDFCLCDITQEDFICGGTLAGKKLDDIKKKLQIHNYKKIKN